jgi:hypothetical protein
VDKYEKSDEELREFAKFIWREAESREMTNAHLITVMTIVTGVTMAITKDRGASDSEIEMAIDYINRNIRTHLGFRDDKSDA